jgi:hypothetical protein
MKYELFGVALVTPHCVELPEFSNHLAEVIVMLVCLSGEDSTAGEGVGSSLRQQDASLHHQASSDTTATIPEEDAGTLSEGESGPPSPTPATMQLDSGGPAWREVTVSGGE